MKHELHYPILKELGLGENEAVVYELLLENGTLGARDLVEKSGIGRGNVYNVLIQLVKRGLAISIQGKKQKYQAIEPTRLRGLLDHQLEKSRRLETAFASTLPQLASTFNLGTGKPAIQIFEGWDGLELALADILTSKTEVLAYVDVRPLNFGPVKKINEKHVRERIKRKILKRIIVADKPEVRADYRAVNQPFTTAAFVRDLPEQFNTSLQIYDGSILFLTYSEERQISFLVKDKHAYELQRQLFEFIWKQAGEVVAYPVAE